MKNQTNTTTEYTNLNRQTHTNLNLNKIHNKSKYYKYFFTKAISLIAIPIVTVSMIPCMAFADNLLIDNSSEIENVSKTIVDVNQLNFNSSTHTISVNLSTITMEDPYQSVNLNEEDLKPEPTNDVTLTDVNNVTVYNIKAKSIQYDSKPIDSQSTEETESTSTYRYANLVSLTNDERYLAYCIIAGEVGGCSYRDKLLVAEALYNSKVRCKLSGHKYSLSHVRSEYGYEGYKDFNAFKQECINCGVSYDEDIIKAVNEVFDNFNMPSQDFILFFHAGYSKWHQNAKTIYLVEDTGAHKYYALKAVPEID